MQETEENFCILKQRNDCYNLKNDISSINDLILRYKSDRLRNDLEQTTA